MIMKTPVCSAVIIGCVEVGQFECCIVAQIDVPIYEWHFKICSKVSLFHAFLLSEDSC